MPETDDRETPLCEGAEEVLLTMSVLTSHMKLAGQIDHELTTKLYLSALNKLKAPGFVKNLIESCKKLPIEEIDLKQLEIDVTKGVADVISSGDIEKFPDLLITLWDNFGLEAAPGLDLAEIQALS
jgi:hypothetical protein